VASSRERGPALRPRAATVADADAGPAREGGNSGQRYAAENQGWPARAWGIAV